MILFITDAQMHLKDGKKKEKKKPCTQHSLPALLFFLKKKK